MMKGYVAIPMPTGELTGYIGITEGRVLKEFQPFPSGYISKEDGLGREPRANAGLFFI
jgi:hypothetical protein